MSLLQTAFVVFLLILSGAFLSLSEISLAGARKLKLKLMAQSGNDKAARVLSLQENSAEFFAAAQIGVNAVGILGGVVGEGQLRPYVAVAISRFYTGPMLEVLAFGVSFSLVTGLFILFSDLMPKRMAMIAPERIALLMIGPIQGLIALCKPLSWVINALANLIFRILKINTIRDENITFDDISAIVDAGAQAGVLLQQEHHFIENVFELEERTVPSSMTLREDVVYFALDEAESSIRQKIADCPYSKFLVCGAGIDQIIGYVDTKDLLMRIMQHQRIVLHEATIRTVLIIPDSLTLSELLDKFRQSKEKFAVVINEYALVVGIITLSDIMMTVMGDWVRPIEEASQIIKRDAHSWLIEGACPIEDVVHALALDDLSDWDNYETIAGFIMYRLRKVPKVADWVEHEGYRFEVVDIDHYKIDQLLVTRKPPEPIDEILTKPEAGDV